jgi:hypothetical protein
MCISEISLTFSVEWTFGLPMISSGLSKHDFILRTIWIRHGWVLQMSLSLIKMNIWDALIVWLSRHSPIGATLLSHRRWLCAWVVLLVGEFRTPIDKFYWKSFSQNSKFWKFSNLKAGWNGQNRDREGYGEDLGQICRGL